MKYTVNWKKKKLKKSLKLSKILFLKSLAKISLDLVNQAYPRILKLHQLPLKLVPKALLIKVNHTQATFTVSHPHITQVAHTQAARIQLYHQVLAAD